jgi:hypothetical protein
MTAVPEQFLESSLRMRGAAIDHFAPAVSLESEQVRREFRQPFEPILRVAAPEGDVFSL